MDELGLTQNTIVVFTSDNGVSHLKQEVDYDFFESVSNLRGLKGSLYEGGIRVPLLVKWPEKIKGGSVSDKMSGFEDWLVTFHDLIEAKTHFHPNHDGQSLGLHLLGKPYDDRKFLYREFSGYGGSRRYGWENGRVFGKILTAKRKHLWNLSFLIYRRMNQSP